MTDNNIDVNIVPVKNGAKRVVVSYYHYSRKDKNHMSSQTDYVIVRFVPCVDSMARKMYVNTKSYDIKNNNQRILFH